MASSNIIITFNSPLEHSDVLIIDNGSSSISLAYTSFGGFDFINVSGNIQQDILNTYNYIQSFYNNTNIYTVTPDYNNQTISITDNTSNLYFTITENGTSNRLTTNIQNENPNIPINIDSLLVVENISNACSLYDVEITTNIQASQLTSPITQTITTNPFTVVGLSRDDINELTFSVTDGITSDSYSNVFTPNILEQYFDLKIISNINNTYTLNVVFNLREVIYTNFNFEYSLDGIDYYNTSSFSELSEGSHTLYVKDNIGCGISIPFEITEQELNVYEREPIFEISQQNSLISVKRETGFKNPDNTLSYEEGGVNRKDFKQLFEKTDGTLTQQIKTSYENIDIRLVDCLDNESIILTEQKTNNYNITDVRDVTITKTNYMGQSYTAVKYVSGKTYNPDTLAQNGEYYLASLVPEFMNTDDGIILSGIGTYRVQDVVFDDNVQVLVLDILSDFFPITPNNVVVKAVTKYNQLPYNIFEYSIDLSSLNGDYYIKYNATDSEFEAKEEITEFFNVSETQEGTYLLDYYNTENNETNYSTGIRNIIRIPYDIELEYLPKDTQDVYDTDTNTVSLESTYRDSYTLYTEYLPKNFIKKIGLALSNDRLFINSMSVIKQDNLEIEPATGSNLYKLSVVLGKSDYAYSSISSEGSLVLPSGQPLNIGNNGVGFLLVN